MEFSEGMMGKSSRRINFHRLMELQEKVFSYISIIGTFLKRENCFSLLTIEEMFLRNP